MIKKINMTTKVFVCVMLFLLLHFNLASAQNPSLPTPNVWWSFDKSSESSNGLITDLYANQRAHLQGKWSYVTDRFGNADGAIHFADNASYVLGYKEPSGSEFFGLTSNLDNFTISFWVKVTANASGQLPSLLYYTSGYDNQKFGLEASDSTLSAIRTKVDNQNWKFKFWKTAALDGGAGWYQIVTVYSSHYMRIYVRKPEQDQFLSRLGNRYEWLGTYKQPVGGVKNWIIGENSGNKIEAIDDFMVWDKALTIDQVQQLFNCPQNHPLGDCFTKPQVISELAFPESYHFNRITKDQQGKEIITPVTFTNIMGMGRKISDFRKVEFVTPDTRNINIDAALLKIPAFSEDWTLQKASQELSVKGKCPCSTIYTTDPSGQDVTDHVPLRFPYYSLPEWSKIFPGYDIYLDANRFISRPPVQYKGSADDKANWYKMPCADVMGLWITNVKYENGTMITTAPVLQSKVKEKYDPSNTSEDALIITNDDEVKLVKEADAIKYETYYDDVIMAVSGHIIAKDGKVIPRSELPPGAGNQDLKKRMVMGIRGLELYMVAFQEEVYSDEIARFMIDTYHVDNVFQFDSGGSVSMLASTGNTPVPGARTGPSVTTASFKRDISPYVDKTKQRFYRPLPTFLAIKVK